MAEIKSEEKQKEERVIEIETERLKSFINHPFRVQAETVKCWNFRKALRNMES